MARRSVFEKVFRETQTIHLHLEELEKDDSDTLQERDELDADWVNLWRRAANKKNLTFRVILPKKAIRARIGLQSKKRL